MLSIVVLAAALTLGADGPQIVVRPAPVPTPAKKDVPVVPVTKPVPPDPPPAKKAAATSGGCACACGCASHGICMCDVEAEKPTAKAPAATTPKASVTTTTRAPVGHTHTCPRCGTTWDHQANPGHNCPNCGTAVYVQDRVPRPVTIRVATVSAAPAPVPTTVYQLPPGFSAAGGCANGSCSAVGRFRR